MLSIIKNKKGFSLVETLIYAGMLLVIVFFITQSIINLVKSHALVEVNREVEYSAEAAMNNIISEVRAASTVNSALSSLGVNPGVLSLSGIKNGVSYSVTFSVQNGKVTVVKDGGPASDLSTSDVAISNLIFRVASSTVSKGIKVEMSISKTRGDYSKTISLSDFAVMRGSY